MNQFLNVVTDVRAFWDSDTFIWRNFQASLGYGRSMFYQFLFVTEKNTGEGRLGSSSTMKAGRRHMTLAVNYDVKSNSVNLTNVRLSHISQFRNKNKILYDN